MTAYSIYVNKNNYIFGFFDRKIHRRRISPKKSLLHTRRRRRTRPLTKLRTRRKRRRRRGSPIRRNTRRKATYGKRPITNTSSSAFSLHPDFTTHQENTNCPAGPAKLANKEL